MNRRTKPGAWTLSLLLALCGAYAAAVDKPAKVKYVPPTGFGGYKWGDLRAVFERLPRDPIGVGAAFTRPVEKDMNYMCKPVASADNAAGGCDFYTMIMTMSKTYEGGGFYVLSEYSIDGQGFRYGNDADAVLLHPVIYQFCANWDDTKKIVPEDFDQLNQFCGVRLLFRTETREQLQHLPGDHVTNYDRVLETLLKQYGKPRGFMQRGRVVIETMEGESSNAVDREFSIWRWCPARDRSLHTSCTASVVLSVDPDAGIGTVLYSTPLLWQYAYARHNGGFKDDRLFRMLHARD